MVEHAPNKTILVKGCERLPRKLFCSQQRIAESAWKRTGTPIPAGALMIEGNSKIRHASTKQVVENSCTSLRVSRVFPLQDCTFQAGVRVRGSFVKLGMLWQLEHRDFCISVSPFLPSFARSPKKSLRQFSFHPNRCFTKKPSTSPFCIQYISCIETWLAPLNQLLFF